MNPMNANETDADGNPDTNTPEAPKRRRGRPSAKVEDGTGSTVTINLSAVTAKRIETLAAHDNKRIADLGIAATCDSGKMMDLLFEQAVNAKFREAFPKAFPKK